MLTLVMVECQMINSVTLAHIEERPPV